VLLLMLLLIENSKELNNGLGLTPQMGWNSWNHFHCNINEKLIRETADAIVSTGLAAAGYEYGLFLFLRIRLKSIEFVRFQVNLDDCWQVSRDSQGVIQPDPQAFPNGISALADYIHSKHLKFGLYSGNLQFIFSFCF